MASAYTNTSQSNGASSSLQSNKHGPARGEIIKKVRKQIGGARFTVDFCEQFRQAIGPNSEKFNNECGIICRKECPFNYMDWRKVPKSIKSSLRERILINFDVDLSSKIVVDVIDFQMGRSFKNQQAQLREHFLSCHGEEDVERAKGMKPTDSNITNDAWHILCDLWSSEKFQAMSRKNSENRGKRKYVSLNGTVSTPRGLGYWEKEGWVNDFSRSSYENMVEIKRQTESTENPPGDLESMQQHLGKRPAYIRGWSRVPSTRSDSTSSRHSTASSNRLSHTEMSVRLLSTKSELAATKSELASTQSQLASTKSELVLMKDEMAELRQMVRSFIYGQPLPSFSSSLNVQDHGSETQDR